MNYKSFLKHDYKPVDVPQSRLPVRWNRLHVFGLFSAAVTLGAVLTVASLDAEAKRFPATVDTDSDGNLTRIKLPLEVPEISVPASAEATAGVDDGRHWETVVVEPGDTLGGIFARLKLPLTDLNRVMALGEPTKTLKLLLPGQAFSFRIEDGRLEELIYSAGRTETLRVSREGEAFRAHTEKRQKDVRVTAAAGTIDSSLFLAGQQAGLSENLIMELANIFAWDIDFALNIRAGDSFAVLFEEHYLDGERIGDGPILAAEFTNQGRTYSAVRFTEPSGQVSYYTPEGLSLRKAFLRTPVSFSHISSQFGQRRHPVLNRMRMHKGVDYAAPTGTPIRAAGDGTVIFRGTKGGYGNTVVIKHGGRYSTLYAHMSRFAKGVGNGSHVRQGQIIGYVGMSGLATGPHLHYEFQVDGAHRNPLTVKLPNANPIAEAYKDEFGIHAQRVLAQLAVDKQTLLAAN